MKTNLPIILLCALLAASSCADTDVQVVKRPESGVNAHYVSNRAPLLSGQFIKLPVGSIQPHGWLRRYLHLQRSGLTGNLGEISAWLDKNNNAWLHPEGKGDHGWEEVPYWLKGYGNIAYILGDSAMLRETHTWIEAALQSQRPDGYFGPLIEHNGKPDLWGNMIMLWCLQSWYEYAQDQRVIPFMLRYFEWQNRLPDHLLLNDYWENSRGGDNLISIYWLYNHTGQPFLLDLAHKIHRNTANWMQYQDLPNWHNVNIAQGFREPASYYLLSHDTAHLHAAYNNFYLIRRLFGQVPGGMFGADENARIGFHDPRQAIETCGVVEQMTSDQIMLQTTGDPMWADHCENVAFNTYPAAVMPDFRSLRYLTAPNMVLSDGNNHAPGIDNGGPFLLMNPFSSRCCQHNHAQGWAYYAENLWLASHDGGLLAALYCPSIVKAKAGKQGQQVVLQQQTNYPFDDRIVIVVRKGGVKFPLYLRIPKWCSSSTAKVVGRDGNVISTDGAASKYIRIERRWDEGDSIILTLPAAITIDRWAQNGNSTSINYGALTFSLKIDERYIPRSSTELAVSDSRWQSTADPSKWMSYEIQAASTWNYGLSIDTADVSSSFEIIRKPYPADSFPFTPQSSPIELRTRGRRIPSWTIDEYGLCGIVPASPVHSAEMEEDLTLIPMGAARLRICAFPTLIR